MSTQRFWVIGGEFRSLNFHQLVEGTQQVLGPFATRREAEQAWRKVSEDSRHLCNVRYMICQEPNAAATGSAAA